MVCFKGRDRKVVKEKERVGRKREKWINKSIGLKNKNGNVEWVVKLDCKIYKITFVCIIGIFFRYLDANVQVCIALVGTWKLCIWGDTQVIATFNKNK